MKRPLLTFGVFAAFVWTVWLANWALKRYGTVPVWPGVEAPAGVYFAGIAFLLRDVLHELGGKVWVVGGIVTGTVVSILIEANTTLPNGIVSIAVASGIAFLASESADFSVYTPLREHNWPAAVGLSQVAGAVVDSVLFLWLAGLLTWPLLQGQLIGKLLLVLPVVLVMAAWKRTRVAPA